MNPRLSGTLSIVSMVFFLLESLLGIGRRWSREKFVISVADSGVGPGGLPPPPPLYMDQTEAQSVEEIFSLPPHLRVCIRPLCP